MHNFKLIGQYSKSPFAYSVNLANCPKAQEIKKKVCNNCNFSEFGIYKNDKYSVSVIPNIETDENQPLTVYLKISNNDWSAMHDWRDFQEIKNKMFGAECEGVEVYPPESLLQDTANTFWMAVFIDATYRSFFTLKHGRMVVEDDGNPFTDTTFLCQT